LLKPQRTWASIKKEMRKKERGGGVGSGEGVKA